MATDLGQTILATAYQDDSGSAYVHELSFEIEGDDFVLVEPRVFYGGYGTVSLHRITLQPVDGDGT